MRPWQIGSSRSPRWRTRVLSLILSGQLVWLTPSYAAPPTGGGLLEERPAEGKPTVILNRLTFPRDVVGAANFEAQLKKTLKTEVSRADWGAGRENRIEYRFSVTELKYTLVDGALRAHCSAMGQLPRGQTAKSELTFSGEPSERVALTNKVLEIVARGVITRLAELERRRRGLR